MNLTQSLLYTTRLQQAVVEWEENLPLIGMQINTSKSSAGYGERRTGRCPTDL